MRGFHHICIALIVILMSVGLLFPAASGEVIARQDWNFPDGPGHVSDPALWGGGNAGGAGESRVATLPSPGPWGGTKVLENYYGVTPATAQPQVGTYWRLPQRYDEVWLETWVRFGPDWEIGPDNPNYPGNYDHKLLFLMVSLPGQGGYTQRWESKVGVFGDLMSSSAATHDIYYEYMKDSSGNRLSAAADAWDGQWHQIRWHAKQGAGDGIFRVWWDGQLVIDSTTRRLLDTQSPGGWFDAILFGGNRNQGTAKPMWFQFGPATVWDAQPNWDSSYTPPAPSPSPGVCGSRNTNYPSSTSSWPSGSQYCSTGSASRQAPFPVVGGSESWTCNGVNNGPSSGTCTASRDASSTPTPPSPPTGCSSAGSGLFNYCMYNDVTLTNQVATGSTSSINYNWGNSAPESGVPSDYFSARYRGDFQFQSGTYEFTATSDDGVRVWVDGQLLIDSWINQAATTYTRTMDLSAGTHQVLVEYYENYGQASLVVDWSLTSAAPTCLEGATLACGTSTGACQQGTQTCSDGQWGSCVGAVGPSQEICDGEDDDCDGAVDEGVTNACGTCGSVPTEVCNGQDDDCDGHVDEGLSCSQPERVLGDADGNGFVELADLILVAQHYGFTVSDPDFDSGADLNGDEIVDLFDLVEVSTNYGSSSGSPPTPPTGACSVAGSGTFNYCFYDDVTLTNQVSSGSVSVIDYPWTFGAFNEVAGSDTFSARFRGVFNFQPGTYEFTATSDDGVRVWVDGQLLIDAWVEQGATTYTSSVDLSGSHEVLVEYYENFEAAQLQVSWQLQDSSSPQQDPSSSTCGNRVVESGESCDDGNIVSGDGCSSSCQTESSSVTGNVIANVYPKPPEAYCGDGIVNQNREQCDLGDANGACPSSCSFQCTLTDCAATTPQCGNSIVEQRETCDSGWFAAECPNPCGYSCQLNNCDLTPRCGNGVPEGSEQCDLGNKNGQVDSPCSSSCQIKSSPAPAGYGPEFTTGDLSADWSMYSSLADINNDPQFDATDGRSRLMTLQSPGPWGGDKVIQMTYPGGKIDSQPQISVEWNLPDQTRREIWLDFWIRFDPWYTTMHQWYTYDFMGRYPDYKTMYLWQTDAQNNWQIKTGVYGETITTAWNANDFWVNAFDPPCVGDKWTCGRPSLDSRTVLYDGHWHRIRYHVRSATDGTAAVEMWIDDRKVMDRSGGTISNDSPFKRITFGGNRNQGAYRDMSVYWGPAELHFSDPGW